MDKRKNILFVTDAISGGVGRVITLLTNEFSKRGYQCSVICIKQNIDEKFTEVMGIKAFDVLGSNHFNKYCLNISEHFFKTMVHVFYSLVERTSSIIFKKTSDRAALLKFYYLNYNDVRCLSEYIKRNEISTVISFLNIPIFLSLLSKKHIPKLILTERNDPSNHEKSKTTMAFIRKLYNKADSIVFQTQDSKRWYSRHTSIRGKIIFNPIKPNLPAKHNGTRQKKIVNFCRISSQKNLGLLINAFSRFNLDYPEYDLYIYGDAVGNGVDGYIESIYNIIDKLDCKDKIHLLPAQKDIHNLIKDYAMFVSSSDFEGMSNSMIEAMAIGLPTICTDCPAGGARAIIKDHENGLLVPVNDVDAMYKAMKEIAENEELAEKISLNGTKLKEELSVDKIVNQWLEMIK